MKIIWNNFIPFKGFKAINLFGLIFARRDARIDERTIRHEKIHTLQMREMLFVFFYIWYVIEWMVRLFQFGNAAYRNISLEREAYKNEDNTNYMFERTRWAFLKYM